MDLGPETTRSATSRRFGLPMLALVLAVGLAAGAGVALLAGRGADGEAGQAAAAKKPLYQCPMHPTITADHPSDCPICGMKLVEVKGAAAEPAAAGKPLDQCPMHPTITADHPSDCPICGMKLVEVKAAARVTRSSPMRWWLA